MNRSVLKKSGVIAVFVLIAGLYSFRYLPDAAQLLAWSNHCLMQVYDPAGEEKLKKWELTLTPDYFLRLRKTFLNGKQEYFSCHLRNFEDLDYTGTTQAGILKIKTRADNIIVQTYNDRRGDVDSMARTLAIPVKNMEPEQVDSLRQVMLFFKNNTQ